MELVEDAARVTVNVLGDDHERTKGFKAASSEGIRMLPNSTLQADARSSGGGACRRCRHLVSAFHPVFPTSSCLRSWVGWCVVCCTTLTCSAAAQVGAGAGLLEENTVCE